VAARFARRDEPGRGDSKRSSCAIDSFTRPDRAGGRREAGTRVVTELPLTITGVVLAGGEGRRMGGPKALLPGPGGRPLVELALVALRAAGAGALRVSVASSGDDAALASVITPFGALVVPDRGPRQGPLGGLEAALACAPTEWVLVVACDMPHLDAALLRRIACLALDPTLDRSAVVPRVDGRAQPLHAAYHRRCLAPVRAALDAGDLRLTDVVAALDPEWLDLPRSASFDNWNTPLDRGR
jgi:molybdopterin-guanine dinucleotide biosynthesis protein A